MMEKRNVVEGTRTPPAELKTPDDEFEKKAANLFTDKPVTDQPDKAKS